MLSTRIIAWIAASLLALPASAQNALDRGQPNAPAGARTSPDRRPAPASATPGRALDANLQFGAGGLNVSRPNFYQELAFRNAIVTGNVLGGRAFRGDVGYSAAGDFRADTGSNDLFEFQRDSAYSGLATQNIRGITPLQFQLSESTAGQTEGVLGAVIVRRSGAGVSAGEVTGASPTADLTVDPYGNLKGSLRSTSDFLLRNARFPRILGSVTSAQSTGASLYMTANPLIGVKALPLDNSVFAVQERPDLLEAHEKKPPPAEDPFGPVGKKIETRTPFDSLRESLMQRSTLIAARRFGEPENVAGPDEPTATPTQSARDTEREFDRAIDELRDAFRKKYLEPQEGESPDAGRQPMPGDPTQPGTARPETDAEPKTPDELIQDAILERARLVLPKGDDRLQDLLAKDGAEDLYSWHLAKGQDALRAARWFEAEERFTAALRARPGDAIAAFARVNAQIGGSLFLSAGVNLRNLFAAYPELIPVRVASDLFPAGDRVEGVRRTLRDRLNRDTPFAREAALLLAYVGWQTGTQRDIFDGFAALDRFHKDAGEEAPALERVLREVWTR